MRISDLWIIQTSNNLDSFDEDDPVFLTEEQAKVEAAKLIAANHNGRADYVVNQLYDAILEKVSSAESSAMSEY